LKKVWVFMSGIRPLNGGDYNSKGVLNGGEILVWKLVYIAFGIFNIAAFLIPKKLSKIEIYATSFFAFTYGVTTDMILDLHYDLYGYFEPGFQWFGLFLYFCIFLLLAYYFLIFFLQIAIKEKRSYISLLGQFFHLLLNGSAYIKSFIITMGGSFGTLRFLIL